MPKIEVRIYCEADGESPVVTWLDSLQDKTKIKCLVKIEQLRNEGHELRRPAADYLEDGIYELRITHSGNQYRILYFFDGDIAVVLSNAFIKKSDKVPLNEIKKAINHRVRYLRDRDKHTYEVTE